MRHSVFLLFLVLFKNFVEKFRTALNFKCQICYECNKTTFWHLLFPYITSQRLIILPHFIEFNIHYEKIYHTKKQYLSLKDTRKEKKRTENKTTNGKWLQSHQRTPLHNNNKLIKDELMAKVHSVCYVIDAGISIYVSISAFSILLFTDIIRSVSHIF